MAARGVEGGVEGRRDMDTVSRLINVKGQGLMSRKN